MTKMPLMRRLLFVVLGAALFFGGAAAGRYYDIGLAQAAQSGDSLPLIKLRELAEAIESVRAHYVDDVSREEMMESAVRGVLEGLDPHSTYFSEAELQEFQGSLSGEQYGGVGIYLGEKNGWIEIIAPLDGLPAAREGLQAGDLIVRIDGTSAHKMPIDEAANMMRGIVGDALDLEVLRPSDNSKHRVKLFRENIITPSVVSGMAEPGYGYVRISRFQNHTVDDLIKSLESLYRKSGGELHGLIVDLRNNPGGVLHASIGVASLFLPAGAVVVSDRGRSRGGNDFVAESQGGFDYADEVAKLPIVLLVNEGSASASEIVAGALQDHDRAVLLGARTYGKASVQSLLPLRSTDGKTALKLTTARYYTPNGTNIQARGIEPDIPIAASYEDETAASDTGGEIAPFREADLHGHLSNEESDNAAQPESEKAQQPAQQTREGKDAKEETQKPQDASNPFIPEGDRQYDEALKQLKTMATAKKQPIGNIPY
ncbi:MAG: S41 family peptidase [Gammaproteobacteria bacterium]